MYCPALSSIGPVWAGDGFSLCFYETAGSAILLAWALIFGTPSAIVAIFRQGAAISNIPNSTSWRSKLAPRLLFLLAIVVIPLLHILQYIVADTILLSQAGVLVYILRLVAGTVAWWCVFFPTHLSIKKFGSLPSHQELSVLGFIVLATIYESGKLVSYGSPSWFFLGRNRSINRDASDEAARVWTLVLYFVALGLTWICFGLTIRILRFARRSARSWDIADLQDAESAQPIIGGARRSTSVKARNGAPATESAGLLSESGTTFKGFWTKAKFLYPYTWPKKSFRLQLHVLACLVFLVAGRVVSPFVPLLYKQIVDQLSQTGTITFPVQLILTYCFLKFMQGNGASGGFLNQLRGFLWIPVQQYTSLEVSVDFFAHLHSLSLQWHLSRKTGEVLRILDRGRDSINSLLSYIVFQIGPTIADIIIAIVFFVAVFNIWFGVIVFVTMILYVISTIYVTEWRTKYRRSMNLADNEARAISTDSLLNFETVKYYNAERYETDRYRQSLLGYQTLEWKSQASLQVLNISQSFVINLGLIAGSLLAGYYVSERRLTVGDYVLFGTYLQQLYGPLNMFGTFYRAIQQAFIDMENLLKLFNVSPDIADDPDAVALVCRDAEIEFRNVSFAYTSDRPILKNISFRVPPGQTFALVGPTGSGKSTVIRLIFRFYEPTSGAILFDGQDIRHVKQETLRSHIGVVPQDTVLFNASIKYNIGYGRPAAPDEEIYDAARAADIHERILDFPDKYDTVVGERGLKLSGGEKQRVCIARTILKNPEVVLLDEATSALDTKTERFIQASLARMSTGRTSVVVAHRLSTIVGSDQILVLRAGEIVERGSHHELLQLENGHYASLWNEQLQAEGHSLGKFSERNTPSPSPLTMSTVASGVKLAVNDETRQNNSGNFSKDTLEVVKGGAVGEVAKIVAEKMPPP